MISLLVDFLDIEIQKHPPRAGQSGVVHLQHSPRSIQRSKTLNDTYLSFFVWHMGKIGYTPSLGEYFSKKSTKSHKRDWLSEWNKLLRVPTPWIAKKTSTYLNFNGKCRTSARLRHNWEKILDSSFLCKCLFWVKHFHLGEISNWKHETPIFANETPQLETWNADICKWNIWYKQWNIITKKTPMYQATFFTLQLTHFSFFIEGTGHIQWWQWCRATLRHRHQ